MKHLQGHLSIRIRRGDLPAPFFINADAAFATSNSVVTPSDEASLDDFEFHQSSNRVTIESAFGLLVRHFPILWKPLQVKFLRCTAIIGACMRLHNFCIDHNVTDDTVVEHSIAQVQPSRWALTALFDKQGRAVDYLNIQRGDGVRRRAAVCRTAPHFLRSLDEKWKTCSGLPYSLWALSDSSGWLGWVSWLVRLWVMQKTRSLFVKISRNTI